MSIMRIIRRDIGSQIVVSRNLQERCVVKILRAFWSVMYLAKALRIAINATRREQLGSRVIYCGQVHSISNWASSSAPTIAGPLGYRQNVPREQLTTIVDAGELWHRFGFGLSWYLSNWHEIDVSKRLYPEAYR